MHFTAFPHSAANGGQPKRSSDTNATGIHPWIQMLAGGPCMTGATGSGIAAILEVPLLALRKPPGPAGRRSRHLPERDSPPFASHPPGNTAPVGRVFPLFSGEHTLMSHRHAPACPLCPGEGALLGTLGLRTWFRCRQCGMDFSRTCRSRRPAPAAATTSSERPA